MGSAVRAREADRAGYVDRDDVRIWFEVHGSGEPTILLIPGWGLPLQSWKAQIPYLARHFRVIAFDPRGTGRSDRPVGTAPYALSEHVADALAVMDAADARSVVILAKSRGAQTALSLAANHPGKVDALILGAPFVPLSPWLPLDSIWQAFDEPRVRRRKLGAVLSSLTGGWRVIHSRDLRNFSRRVNPLEAADRFSRHSMMEDFSGFALWFQGKVVCTEPHSTKQCDDTIAWLMSTGPRAAADAFMGDCVRDSRAARELCAEVSCPVLVIHGDCDLAVPFEWGKRLARLTGGKLLAIPGAGHLPGGRYPVVVNLAIREFVDALGDVALTSRGDEIGERS